MQQIDEKTAAHLLRRLPYREWMSIGILHDPKGIGRIDIGSLEELLWSIRPAQKSLSAVRYERLERWLRESIEDTALADKVAEVLAQELSYVETSRQVYELVENRVEQLLAHAPKESNDETLA